MLDIQNRLFALQDLKYRDFQAKLTPTQEASKIIGVRTPELRKLAKELAKTEGIEAFLNTLPHQYYDEYNLHGFILCENKEYSSTITALERFLPWVDNWATCDLMRPKSFNNKKNHARLLEDIQRWMNADAPFTIRFGIEMLMTFFLDDEFENIHLKWVSNCTMEHYYVKMMVAWYFATALAKQWESTITYLEQPILAKWTHNKTIQKAIESYRITSEQKDYLRTLKL